MVQRFVQQYGAEQAEQLCQWFNQPAALWIRTNTLMISRKALKEQLEQKGIAVEESRYTPEGLKILSAVNLHQLEEFQQGLFTVQDESSMLVRWLPEPMPGQRVLDVCSARRQSHPYGAADEG